VMVENHGNGYTFMMERVYNFIERILARQKEGIPNYELIGNLTDPVSFEQMRDQNGLKELLGARAAEQARLIGTRTGELHIALASANHTKDFNPEAFSLHYQRSLYAALVSLVREVFQNLKRNLSTLPDDLRAEAEGLLNRRNDVLSVLKRIYTKKLDVIKTRIHGNYTLEMVLFTGKDLAMHGFGGDPYRQYSERRLKRSPLLDVATMLRSFHNVAYEGFFMNNYIPKENAAEFSPFARLWAHYMGGFFMKAYLDTVEGTLFIPKEKTDFTVMLQTYMLEKSLHDLNKDLHNKSGWMIVPLRTIKSILKSS
jgi:maltose alpha-D-glucosyltransferase/alpha-amylase